MGTLALSPVPQVVSPAGRAWHAAGANPGCLKAIFLQHLVSFAIVWVVLLVQIIMKESFNLSSQTDTHTQKKEE